MQTNVDVNTVKGFGDEWSRFDQSSLSEEEHLKTFDEYFKIFDWDLVPKDAVGFDLGCGSGRWAKLVAPRVGKLICVDASQEALQVAKKNLDGQINCEFHHSSVAEMPILESSMDFGYSLGVLHHIPEPLEGIKLCTNKLKNGAPFLIYLYYAFDNKPLWFKALWRISDGFRLCISKLPSKIKHFVTDIIAAGVYFPIARIARLFEKSGFNVNGFPLSIYREKSFYMMRTDALDRFGTRLEHRFTRTQIQEMLTEAGLEEIRFSEEMPYWCAVGLKMKV